MSKTKSKKVMVAPSEQELAELKSQFPQDVGFSRVLLPRLSLVSQDVTEGKGKAMKVVVEAGTFVIEKPTDELNEQGKSVWSKEEIGTKVEGIIIYQRKQLRFYDSASQTYTSSPIYDTDDEVVPLFCNKQEVDRGTPKELRAREVYQGKSAKGKDISKLEENRILYVLVDGELYQMNLRGTSMYAFLTYARQTLVPSVLTAFSSEAKENGSIEWNQMTFTAKRNLDGEEVRTIIDKVRDIKNGIAMEKAYFAQSKPEEDVTLTEAQKAAAREAKDF